MSAASAYQASPIRPRRTRAQIEELDYQIFQALAADRPQSVRHVFYLMTNPRLREPVEKSERGYNQVQDRIKKLRRAGRVPYSWLSDSSRRGYFVDTFENTEDFLLKVRGLYRADLWRHSDVRCEVWVESRSIAGVVQADCEELAVSLYPCGGFTSITFAYQAAEYINNLATQKPIVVLYIGDFDPAGVLIDIALERELRKHLEVNTPIEFRRIGITPEQIRAYDLPAKPRKAGEKRAPHIEGTVEAEAMPAHFIRRILRDEIEALLPTGVIAAAKIAEDSERELIAGLAGMVSGGAR